MWDIVCTILYLAPALVVQAIHVNDQKFKAVPENQDASSVVDIAIQEALFAKKIDGGATVERKYKNYSTIEFTIRTHEQAVEVERFIETHVEVDSWNDEIGIGSETEIMVSPENQDAVMHELQEYGLAPTINDRDVGLQLKQEFLDNLDAYKGRPRGSIVGVYPTLKEIYVWIGTLPDKYPNLNVAYKSLGKSAEGKDILMVSVASGNGLPIIYLDGGIHAREWIATAVVIWQLNELLSSKDPEIIRLRNSFEWQFVPNANPDGYIYTHKVDRLWRKNRRANSGSTCAGVDLNRNWGTNWGTKGISKEPCSEIYPGTEAFSEPETQALKSHFLQYKSNTGDYDSRMKVYISYHAFMQMWLGPPGSGSKPSDFDRSEKVGAQAAAAVEAKHHEHYIAGSPADILYEASGGSFDWIHQEIGVKYTYSPELRPAQDRMYLGFSLPPREIIPAAEEAWAGALSVVRTVAQELAGALQLD